MKFHEIWIFILQRLTLIDDERKMELTAKLNKWYDEHIYNTKHDEEVSSETKNPVIKLLRKYGENPWVQLGFAGVMIVLFRWVHDLIYGVNQTVNGEYDEDDNY